MREKKYFARYRPARVETPNLVAAQVDSYKLLLQEGVKDAFKEFTPINDYSGKKFDLEFVKVELGEPKVDEHYAKAQKMSLDIPLRAIVKLKNKTLGTEKEQEIFLADFPVMTEHGTFVINGVERKVRHSAALLWRAAALCQEEIETEKGLPLPRGATAD